VRERGRLRRQDLEGSPLMCRGRSHQATSYGDQGQEQGSGGHKVKNGPANGLNHNVLRLPQRKRNGGVLASSGLRVRNSSVEKQDNEETSLIWVEAVMDC
jgi:hypothetical protein